MQDNQGSQGGQPQQLNLQQIAQQFMAGLQRHFDMLAFNLAARDGVEEAAYNARVNGPKVMPSAPHHQNFEQMQAYARDLLMRQVLGDCMNLAVAGMNNAHLFLSLVKATQANSNVSPEAQGIAQKSQQSFVPLPIHEKFNRLEKDYGIMCELEDTIISLGLALQALMQKGGIVNHSHLDDDGELAFELKAVKILNRETESENPKGRLVDQRKVFVAGDAVTFNDGELQLVLITVASFADALFKAVSLYAKSVKDSNEG